MSKKWITIFMAVCMIVGLGAYALAADHGPPQQKPIAVATVAPVALDQAVTVQGFLAPHVAPAVLTANVTYETETGVQAMPRAGEGIDAILGRSTQHRNYRRWEAQAMKLGVNQLARPLGAQPGMSRTWTARGRSTLL